MSYPYQIKSFDEYKREYEKSIKDPAGFWGDIAEHFTWRRKWDEVVNWNFKEPKVEWFKGAKLNITENCLDRYLESRGNQPAIIWEPNDPEEHHRTLTYRNRHEKVFHF